MSDKNLILIGKVTTCHGIKGWVTISSFASSPKMIVEYELYLKNGSHIKKIEIEDYKIMPKKIIIKISGINSIDQADHIIGQDIFIKSNQLDDLGDYEYYWYQLIGCKVLSESDKCIGTVTDILRQEASDILVIKKLNTKSEILIPFIKDYLIQVDLIEKFIKVDWKNDY